MKRWLQIALDALETELKYRRAGAGCFYVAITALVMTILLVSMQGHALWISPDALRNFHHDLLVWAQVLCVGMLGVYIGMAWYGLHHYRSSRPHSFAVYFLITSMLVSATLTVVLYGLHDTPMGMMLLASIVLARAWFPVRILLPGILISTTIIVTSEIMVQFGILDYAPLLIEPIVSAGAMAPWWMGWFLAIANLVSLFSAALLFLTFMFMDRYNEQLQHQARVDALTGLSNRATFMKLLDEENARQLRSGRPACLLMCDVDHFKKVNDTYGHPAGDQVLRHLGQLLQQSIRRPSDVAARYGGEEFVLLLPETNLAAARAVAERLREQLYQAEFESDGQRFSVTVSIGISEASNSDADKALKVADDNLYHAKRQGRDRIVASVAA